MLLMSASHALFIKHAHGTAQQLMQDSARLTRLCALLVFWHVDWGRLLHMMLSPPASLSYNSHAARQWTCYATLHAPKSLPMQVRSRFVPEGGDAEDFAPFLRAMKGMGFAKKALDCSNSHFVTFEMHRQGKSIKDAENQAWPLLRACTYKKR